MYMSIIYKEAVGKQRHLWVDNMNCDGLIFGLKLANGIWTERTTDRNGCRGREL